MADNEGRLKKGVGPGQFGFKSIHFPELQAAMKKKMDEMNKAEEEAQANVLVDESRNSADAENLQRDQAIQQPNQVPIPAPIDQNTQQQPPGNVPAVDHSFSDELSDAMNVIEDFQGNQTPDDEAVIELKSRLQGMKERIDQITIFQNSDELEDVFKQISADGPAGVLKKLDALNINLEKMRAEQNSFAKKLESPIVADADITRGEFLKISERSDNMRKSMNDMRVSVGEWQKSTEGEIKKIEERLMDKAGKLRTELKVFEDSVESLKNSFFMLNRKIDLLNQEDRVIKTENKIKEIIFYLHKLDKSFKMSMQNK